MHVQESVKRYSLEEHPPVTSPASVKCLSQPANSKVKTPQSQFIEERIQLHLTQSGGTPHHLLKLPRGPLDSHLHKWLIHSIFCRRDISVRLLKVAVSIHLSNYDGEVAELN